MTNYFYAWKTASDFADGGTPVARATTHDALHAKVSEHKRFFTALHLDGTWVDLWNFGPGDTTFGREVSEARSGRYVRARRRKLEEEGRLDVQDSVPIPEDSPEEGDQEPTPEVEGQVYDIPGPSEESGENPYYEDQTDKEKFQLNIDPNVVKAIYEFLALPEEVRTVVIEALAALSISAEPFKSAVKVMLDDNSELTVGFHPAPAPEENTNEA